MGRQRAIGALIAAAILAAACGGTASPAPSAGASAGPSISASAGPGGACPVAADDVVAAAAVTIRDFAFGPSTVTIKAGEAVSWTNEDSSPHRVATLDGACDTGSIPKGATVALVFPDPGTYRYHCAIHASMPTATVEVTD